MKRLLLGKIAVVLLLATAMVPVLGGVASADTSNDNVVQCVIEHYKRGESFWMPCFYPEP